MLNLLVLFILFRWSRCQQGFGQGALGAEGGTTDLPEGCPEGAFRSGESYREFLTKKNIITCFNRVLLIGGGDVAVQRGVPGS